MSSLGKEPEAAQTTAVIDIGANSVRMEIADVQPDGHTEVFERIQRPVRLGHDAFVTGVLHQDTIAAVIAIMRDFRRILDTYQVSRVHAVATSAVREARNADSFLDRVGTTVGIEVEIIEPSEQCRLVVMAVRKAIGDTIDLRRRNVLIVEVGGGSTLVTILRRGAVTLSQSYDLGSIRMQETLAASLEQPGRAAALLRSHIATMLESVREAAGLNTVNMVLAVGGDARFAAHQVGKPDAASGLEIITLKQLDDLIADTEIHAADDLVREYGFPFALAETLVPALLVYQALLRATRVRRMFVSQVSMRDGLLLDIPRDITGQDDPELAKSIIQAARSIGARFRCDAEHAEHVAGLSLQLFDELQREHRLRPRDRLLLEVAALLHDTGKFINNRVHHKHSAYIIMNTDVFGLRRKDMALISQVARYHRRSVPRSDHEDYMAFSREDRMLINKLAAILRVANALDRGHWQKVRSFSVDQQDRDFTLFVKGADELLLERHMVVERSDLFEDIFGMRVRIEDGGLERTSARE
jgi:exopolyphosphatase/guanosine-5'-triphosphate,3'-diphosphate pyrophosphatase